MSESSPSRRTRHSIVLGEEFQVQKVDETIIVQVRCRWSRSAVTHSDGQRIELIDHVIAVYVARQQTCSGFCSGIPSSEAHRSLVAEEATSCGKHGIVSGRSRKAECSIRVGNRRCKYCVVGIKQAYSHG